MKPKFKAWDKDERVWIPVSDILIGGDGKIWTNDHDGEGWKKEIVPIEIVFSTGLLDKSGKEIFEGDIITVPMDVRHKGVIKWHNKSACFYLDEPDIEDFAWTGLIDCIEVIGNIYSTPELLRGRRGDE